MLTKPDDTSRGSALWVICVDMARDGSIVDMHSSSDRPPGNKVFLLAI